MPNVPPRMSPFALKRTGIPSNDTPILVRLICVRTSARLAVPFLQARSTARPITWAATYDGAPKYSPLPPCDRWYARTVLSFALTGKNESYAPLIAANRHARRPQLRLHDVGETSRVSLLVVDDVDALELQPLDDEVRDGGTLNAIGRNGSEEEAGSRPVGRERGVRRRARYEAEPRVLDRRRGRLHLVRAGRADNGEDLRVRRKSLRRLDRFRSAAGTGEDRVAVGGPELRLLVRLVVTADVVLEPMHLLLAQ